MQAMLAAGAITKIQPDVNRPLTPSCYTGEATGENFMIQDDGFYLYERFEGTVVEYSNWSETHVSGGGGGGAYGYSSYAPVTSRVVERNRVWITFDDGTQQELNDLPISCRPGHRLHIIGAKTKWGKEQIFYFYGYYNATTGQSVISDGLRSKRAYATLPFTARGSFYFTLLWLATIVLTQPSTPSAADAAYGGFLVKLTIGCIIAAITLTQMRLAPRKKRLTKAFESFVAEVSVLPTQVRMTDENGDAVVMTGKHAAA